MGGRRIHVHCTGGGSPTVVLDSALGVPALEWRHVQPGIAEFTSVCSYDRAGYGYSDAGPLPRTMERRVDDLRAALRGTGRAPPYVLVGHSMGGLLARSFAYRFPDEVAGIVLVDSSHETQFDRFPKSVAAGFRTMDDQIAVVAALLPLGLPRLLLAGEVRKGSPDVGDELVALTMRRDFVDAFRSEGAALVRGGEVPAGQSLGNLPLLVLTAGKPSVMGLPSAADDREASRIWRDELQPELVRLSPRGRQVVVKDSGHMIPVEQPGAIVDGVREVVEEARQRGGISP